MIVEYNVTNYRSINEIQTLKLTASRYVRILKENVIHATPNILKSAVILGGNGSGKSNFINSLLFMKEFVIYPKPRFNKTKINNYTSYKFENNSDGRFEISMLIDDMVYNYGFVINNKKVIKEWLYTECSPRNKNYLSFSRTFDELQPGNTIESVIEPLESNRLLLTYPKKVKNNSLDKIYKWFDDLMYLNHEYSLKHLSDNHDEFVQLVKTLGIEIKYIEDYTTSNELKKVKFISKNNNMTYMDEESTGNIKIFQLAGLLMEAIKVPSVIIIDDLDMNLHPLVLRKILEIINDTNSQLIFSSHNTSILNEFLLRRDQIWFMEKDNEESRLTSLSDFKPKYEIDKNLDKSYLTGRFGGIPLLL